MNGFFGSVLNLVITTRSNKRYKELQANPEEAAKSQYFGRKFIGSFIGALVMAGIAVAFAAVCLVLQTREADLVSGFLFFVYIACFACAVILALYALIFLLARLKYVKWQRSLNDLPIGKKAKSISYVALVLVIALSVLAIVLTVMSLT